ncbi:hypothetical protein SERLA73DRAFT_178477 [Serpula lacrymans var. lacrymans S7.3]|uniref:Uncharacterized protein n=1 Tax=Serpula lacrymans var. lacrymans (strain S7.3) TaxID=936435 RepID=F8PRQ2_SERL3|nr:hypothetical protein SERLA73DRAFT_178477 [Serpula lacrymans var. lacrymans S7.3]
MECQCVIVAGVVSRDAAHMAHMALSEDMVAMSHLTHMALGSGIRGTVCESRLNA